MAEKLGYSSRQGYHFYEGAGGFKGRYLPMDLAERIAGILADHGISSDEVLALAGRGTTESAERTLSHEETHIIDSIRLLEPSQRAALMVLVNAMLKAQDGREPTVGTLHAPQTSYRAAAAR